MNRRTLVIVIAAFLSTTVCMTAAAQGGSAGSGTPSVEDSAAERFFEAGRIAFNSGYYDQALRAFQEAYDLSHRSALLYNIAVTLDRLERQREALEVYERFLAEQPESDYARAVQSRIDIIRSHLPPPTETTEEPADVIEEVAQPAEETAEPTSTPSGSGGAGLLEPAIAMLAVGGVGLVTFAVAAPIGLVRHDEYASTCAPDCGPGAVDEVRAIAITADVGLGVGLLGAAIGGVLLGLELTAPGTSDVTVTPVVTPTSAGVTVAGPF